MPERLNFDEAVENKEGAKFLPYCPTDLERAEKGLNKFLELKNKNPVFRKAVESDKRILHACMGLRPETGYYGGAKLFESLSSEEEKELKNILEKEFGLKIFSAVSRDGNPIRSMLNAESITKVIRNCPIPDLFPPEAKADPVKWVLENHEEWGEGILDDNPLNWDDRQKIVISRFGVLSGYAPHASKVFPDAEIAEHKLKAHDLVPSEDERSQYYAYTLEDRDTRKLPKTIEEKFNIAVKNSYISRYEDGLLRDRFLPNPLQVNSEGINYVFGTGFFDEDKKFYDNVVKIMKSTGADKIT